MNQNTSSSRMLSSMSTCRSSSSSSSSSRCKTPRTSSSPLDLLPRDLLLRVLSRVPTISLLELRSVCREWHDIIDDPDFAVMQATAGVETTRVLLVPGSGWSVVPRLGDEFISILRPVHLVRYVHRTARASCHGLLCFACDGGTYLLNPLTKEIASLTSAEPSLRLHSVGIGLDRLTSRYKIVRLRCSTDGPVDGLGTVREETLRAEVLDQGSQSWRDVGNAPSNLIGRYPVFAAGSIHWEAYGERGVIRICSFDIAKEEFTWTPCPELNERADVVDFQGELGLVDRSYGDVWVMDESGRWKKEYSVRLPALKRRYQLDVLGGGGRKIVLSRWKDPVYYKAARSDISWTLYDPGTGELEAWRPWRIGAVCSVALSLLSPAKLWNGGAGVVAAEIVPFDRWLEDAAFVRARPVMTSHRNISNF